MQSDHQLSPGVLITLQQDECQGVLVVHLGIVRANDDRPLIGGDGFVTLLVLITQQNRGKCLNMVYLTITRYSSDHVCIHTEYSLGKFDSQTAHSTMLVYVRLIQNLIVILPLNLTLPVKSLTRVIKR